ncbi:hypothetical protein ACFY9S_38845 [Streptomyces sp. NPDC012474]|uniref:hypothetical protein n=1 Tax=Streptomyces sp. NPDC012474 TaxID=3364836 RepID=UPI0036EF5E24
MTHGDPRTPKAERDCSDEALDTLLIRAHRQLGIAVTDRTNAQGGPPELRPPDLALDRLLAATHRSVGTAVTRRLAREDRALAQNQTLEARMQQRGPLFNRPSQVRVKYRRESLRLARRYWPADLAEGMRVAVRIVQNISDLLQTTEQLMTTDADQLVTQLRGQLRQLSQLPKPQPAPVTLTGVDYLVAIESVLAEPAERLLHDLYGIRQMLDEELEPAIGALKASSDYLIGVDAVVQDLIDDLTQACDQADALARAVTEVERASSEFVGADLSSAKLDGVLLEGILWDATTVWPGEWESLIRRASLPSSEEQGVLIVAAEPSETILHAEA